jgi:hypothetical protein
MNYQEQITSFRQKRNEAVERQDAIMKSAGDEGRTLDEEEASEFDSIGTEVAHIDKHIERLSKLAGTASSQTTEVKGSGPTILVRKQDRDDEFQGQSFVRCVIAQAVAELSGFRQNAGQIAEARWGKTHPNLVRVIKAGVPGGSVYGTGTDSWGQELADADTRFTGDFVEFIAGMTVYDRLALTEIPANVHVKGQEGIGTGYWVGEKQPIPMSALDFNDVELRHLKVGALTAVSTEWLKLADRSAEMRVRDSLAQASSQRTDTTFLSTDAAVTGVSPAGILASPLVGITSSGLDATAVRTDLAALYAPFFTAKNSGGLTIVTTPSLAKAISLQTNALGQQEFGGLGAGGGTLLGDPVVTGDNVGATHLILLKPSDIWRIGASGVEVSLSRDATIEMDTVPTGEGSGPTAQSVNQVSMFQSEQVAFKVVRSINFAKRRASAVQYISDAAYTASGLT